jgi:photosystem II stability/assembly factor-like uncharacterized protein
MNMRLIAALAILSGAITAGALLQSCVRDVAPPEEEPSDWMDVPFPPVVYLDANAIVSDKHGTLFLGGDRDAPLWRSADRGLTWTEKKLGLKPSCRATALLVKGGEKVFAALAGGGVFISRDHGENWTQINNHLTDLGVLTLAAGAAGEIYAGTNNGRLFRSDNDGGVWVEAAGNPIRAPVTALVTDSAGTIYAGSGGQGVFFSPDSGRTWVPSSSGLENLSIRCLAIHRDGYLLAGTDGSSIYRSAGAGEPWARIDQGAVTGSVNAIATDRTGGIFVGMFGNGAIRSRDGGASWERADIGMQGLNVNSLLCADDFLLAGTWDYGVFRSTNGGASWSASRNYGPTDLNRYSGIWFANSLSIDSCGTYYFLNERSIVRSRDGGETWIRACYGVQWRMRCLAIHPNSLLFAGSESGGIYVSNDSGDSWSRADTSLSGSLEVFALEVAQNGAIFGHTDRGVLRSADGGSPWENVFSEAPVTAMSTGSGGCVYIGTDYRGVLGSTDNGDTWRRMTDSLRIYSIEADRAGNVFVLAENGILCSGDGGQTWKTIQLGRTSSGGLITSGDYYWYSAVAAPGGEVAMIFDNKGTLYISEDCFASWKTVSAPFAESSIFLSPDGHLFISGQIVPGLHRSRNALF